MKLFYFFLLFFTNGVNLTKGQLHMEFPGEMLLRFVFHPNYSFYTKYCCKFTRYGCMVFVNSKGYVHSAYEGRIETNAYPGIFDVRIWNVHSNDAGTYRCEIRTPQNSIYQDFQVVIADVETAMNPILDIPKSTIPPVHQILDTHQEISSNGKWSLKFLLGTIFGIVVITLIISITLAVICYKKKSKDTCVRSVRSAPSVTEEQLPQELIYTTVDFKCHQKTFNIYANLDIHNSRPDLGNALPPQDNVEYASIAGVL
ncbi:uncharacterized protein LOC128530490 isoform X2 [Clarias gariepinus]|uniref:uncharacterized protein LOC128530490 isoform X2 n=1 Tax=Clarias gariepinus TaxID=13013 RepID=UPI00234DFF26|nr:uncharacterized protein LOC128530490 isoform X2 [Clarias gariepinus]